MFRFNKFTLKDEIILFYPFKTYVNIFENGVNSPISRCKLQSDLISKIPFVIHVVARKRTFVTSLLLNRTRAAFRNMFNLVLV